jgi:hypothetical protein
MVLYRNFLYREFHFRLFLTTTAKSLGYSQELIQIP